MELSTEDKQRIEQANRNEFMPYKAGWIAGAEYATIYEREQQAELRNKVIDQEKQIQRLKNDLRELGIKRHE